MSLGLLLLFVTISSVNLSLGFFLGRMFYGPKGTLEPTPTADGPPAAAEKPNPAPAHH